jgi:L-Ala-D/L-Glu epimerase / N-acetyl-D-glutamate racemase
VKRRDVLKAAGWGAALPFSALAALPAPSADSEAGERAAIHTEIRRLKLRHTWTTTMSSSEYRDTLHLTYTRSGVTGHGEGAPIVRYKEDAAGAQAAVESIADFLATANPWEFEKVMGEVFRRIPGKWAAKSAINLALMDWVGQKLQVPLYRYLGLAAEDAPVTTFSIGIDTPEVTRQKVREAADFPVLKIKVGLSTDEATIAAVRSVTNKPLRVDANEGWKTKEEALEKIRWLSQQGVEFVEQPLPAAQLEDMRWVHQRSPLPLIADESCLRASDIPGLVGAFDGVNVKLDKSGGMLEAYRMIQVARALGLKTMLGCMISSSVTVTAAAHLSPLVNYADLDGNLLIANDPFVGVTVQHGKLLLPDRPGLGLLPQAG